MGVSFTIKDCPSEVRAALKLSAERHRRSQNAEAIVWLEERARASRVRLREPELLKRIEGLAWGTHLASSEQASLRKAGRP